MFVGHLGVGLALRRATEEPSLGLLLPAVLLPDFLLGLFVWRGLEHVIVPADYARRHYLRFVFPYSHGLLATVAWSALTFALVAASRRPRLAAVTALAVFSHFVCDVIEHPPQLPLAGAGSSQLGLGLWDQLPLALGLEVALVGLGLALYLGSPARPNARRRHVLIGVLLGLSALQIVAQAGSATPPSSHANIIAWTTQPVILGLFGLWIDHPDTPISRRAENQAAQGRRLEPRRGVCRIR